jgi:hypothetical protein
MTAAGADRALVDDPAEAEVGTVQRVVTEIRRFRSDQGLRPTQRVVARLDGLAGAGIEAHEPLIRSLVRLDLPGDDFQASATLAMPGSVNVALDSRGAIDVAAERARMTKDRAAAEKEAGRPGSSQPRLRRQGPGAGGREDPRPARSRRGRPDPDRRCPGGASLVTDRTDFASVEAELAGRGFTRMVFELDRIESLLDLLGSPQRAYPSIHLTGTNGKTSTARMIDSLLRAFGLHTGRYTSPHLETVRERISLDGEPVGEERFTATYREVKPLAELVDERSAER